ncbi:MAG TPA: molecular chaperone DnaK, partial [Aigarchaeota archaeon]|nr:molecular chaperone DnaK [Aigarchaeota archaeon]
AEQYAEQDRRRKQEAELRNEADALLYTVDKALTELGDKTPQDVKKEVEEAAKELREALKGTDIQAIKEKLEKLRKTAQRIGATIYGQGSGFQTPTGERQQEDRQQ